MAMERYTIRVSDEDLAAWQQASKDEGLDLSKWIREAASARIAKGDAARAKRRALKLLDEAAAVLRGEE